MSKSTRIIGVLATCFIAAVLAGPSYSEEAVKVKDVPHPYILWTKEEAAALRKQYEANDWMKQSLAKMAKERKGETFVNLFRYQVLGDEKAGDRERKYLLSFINAKLDGKDPSGMNIGKHYDNYLHALRYDVFYDTLTKEQRQKLEATFRRFIQYELDHPYHNTKISLLPNMQLPRLFAAHLMTVALRDEALIRKLWAAPSGFKWYMDDYLSDGGFYNEEFGKMTSLIGEMLLYCRGLDRLGLDELGYGYKGKGGATMRHYVESYLWIGYPRTEIPGGMPRYERIAMGDARGHKLGLFQHANVQGYLPAGHKEDDPNEDWRGFGEWEYFYGANMNGRDHRGQKVGKLQYPQWFEILHAKYPDGPFGYFLAQMRGPDEEAYIPTPFWGLKPIKPSDVKAPAAPSAVYPERGFAMLRAEESPQYWTSPKPAVALQFATLYVHYTSDCFSLLGYHAFNRPIYLNRCISRGYNGGPWDFSVLGHCGVVVDSEQAQPIGRVPTRQQFTDAVKFVSARGKLAKGAEPYKGRGEVRSSDQPREPFTDVYSNIDLSRSLFLTDEYLFDVYWLKDVKGEERNFYWLVHPIGVLDSTDGWQASDQLQKTLFNIEPIKQEHSPRKRWAEKAPSPSQSWIIIDNEKRKDVGEKPVDVKVVQRCVRDDVKQSVMGPKWYEREVGVRVRMLGEKGTQVYAFDTPTNYRPGTLRSPRGGQERAQPETGGVSVTVAREATETMFVALHEPFEGGKSRIDTFERMAQTDDAVLVRIVGGKAGVNDRVMLRIGDKADQAITLESDGESFTFVGHGYVRIAKDRLIVSGNVTSLKVSAPGVKQLTVNGKSFAATASANMVTWSSE